MKKFAKVSLMIAGCLFLAGILAGIGTFALSGGNFRNFYYTATAESKHDIKDTFSSIFVDTFEADVEFLLSEDDNCRVECLESENVYHTISVENDTLTISRNDKRNWYEYIGLFFSNSKITVYLNEKSYKNLSVGTTSGDVIIPKSFSFSNVKANSVSGDVNFASKVKDELSLSSISGNVSASECSPAKLSATTTSGYIALSNIACKNIESGSVSGNIKLGNVISDRICTETTSGEINLEKCDGKELTLNSVSGNIIGNLLTAKTYITETVSGTVQVPNSQSGGKCSVKTISGNIIFTESNNS